VKRRLLRSPSFIRVSKQLVKRNPERAKALAATLAMLEENAHDPRLHAHQLRGGLKGFWAASGGYDFRVIFRFVEYEGQPAIMLVDAGTHDEVY
jgi:mRNA-degrading endonuclease YafQ of YafQ-DinJ toxin-antitoxin module